MADPALSPLLAFTICKCAILSSICKALSPFCTVASILRSVQCDSPCKFASLTAALVQVVGMAAIEPLNDLSQLQCNFHTACIPGLTQDKAADKCIVQLKAFCMNPIFGHRARQVLLEILRCCKASMMLFLLQPDQTPPEALKVFR